MSLSKLFTGSDAKPLVPGEDEMPTGAVAHEGDHVAPVPPIVATEQPPVAPASNSRRDRRYVQIASPPLYREAPARSRRKKREIPHGGPKKDKKALAEVRPMRPPVRGWFGRGGGQAVNVAPADEFRGTTVQVCGLYPFSVGTGTPMIGVPLGKNLATGAAVCCDPISWFQRAQLISNPSMFVLGKPGLGKSSLTRRMATGLAGYGTIPLVLGDLKPDYVDLIEALDGQVITLGRGRGYLNILDPGEAAQAADRLRARATELQQRSDALRSDAGTYARDRQRKLDEADALALESTKCLRSANQVIADAHGRRHTMVSALLTILRSEPPTDREETIIDRALKYLDENYAGVPVLGDLLRVIQEAPDEIRQVALDRGDLARYKIITENLEASLIGLTTGGRLGEIFSQQTTTPMRRDRPVVYDVSSNR